MTRIDTFVDRLVELVPLTTGTAADGFTVEVDDLELELPIEARIEEDGLRVSAPRGRLITGFDPPHGRLQIRLVRTTG